MGMTLRLITVAAVCALLVIAIVVVRIAHDPYSYLLSREVPPWPEQRPSGSRLSEPEYADVVRLWNHIARQSSLRWSDEDKAWLASVLTQPRPVAPEPVPAGSEDEQWVAQMRRWSLYDDALTILSDQIGLGAPLPQEFVDRFELITLADLQDPNPDLRLVAISNLQTAGWLDRPDIRPLIESIRESDPDDHIRDRARRALLWADGKPVENPDCPTCPGHGGG